MNKYILCILVLIGFNVSGAQNSQIINCSVVMSNSNNNTVNLTNCGTNQKEIAAFKEIEQKINQIIKNQNIDGKRLLATIDALNVWLPVFSSSLTEIKDIGMATLEAVQKLSLNIRPEKSSEEILNSFYSMASKKPSGYPISSCDCHFPARQNDPLATFKYKFPNTDCVSQEEKVEACSSSKAEYCVTKVFDHGYPPFRRICA